MSPAGRPVDSRTAWALGRARRSETAQDGAAVGGVLA